jgi:hypothetical protein
LNRWYNYTGRFLLRGIAAGMKKSDFLTAKARDRKLPGISCSAYCMDMAIKHLCEDAEVWKELERYGMRLIVETSTVADAGIRDAFNRGVAANRMEKYLHPISFAKKQSARGLQLGDYLAYYSQRFAETAIHDSFEGVTDYLDIAKRSVSTIMKLGEKFSSYPEFRALLASSKRRQA